METNWSVETWLYFANDDEQLLMLERSQGGYY